MAVTDLVTLFLSIFLLIRGASRGFMNSLLGPFSIIATTIISIIYYQKTQELIISLIIGLAGPLLLSFLLRFLLKSWAAATQTDSKPDFLSRLGGAALTLSWGWVFIIFTLILLAMLPPWGATWTTARHDVIRSRSYAAVKPWQDIFFAASQKDASAAAKSLARDPRFQKVLHDPETQKEIQAHDVIKLLNNPKIIGLTKQIMNDPAALK